MAKIDLKDGFFHVPLHNSIVDYFTIFLPINKVWLRWRVMSFGGAAAPFIFQAVQIELRRMFLELPEIKVIKKLGITVYIDDWFLTHENKEVLAFVYSRLIQFLSELGFLVHPEKRSPPVQCLEIIGFEIDSVSGVAKISEKKQAKSLGKLSTFLNNYEESGKIRVDALQSIIGSLQHITFIVKGGKQALTPVYACVPLDTKTKYTRLSSEALKALVWWETTLKSPLPPRRLYLDNAGFDFWEEDTFADPWKLPHSDPQIVVITSDASSSGFAFFTGPHHEPRNLFAGLWSPAQAILSSNFREAKTIEIARCKLRQLTKNKFVLHRTDNSCAKVVTNKLASSATALMPIAATLRSCDRADNSVSAAMHISGESNVVSDFYSRIGETMWRSVKIHVRLSEWCLKFALKINNGNWTLSGPSEINRETWRKNQPNLIILNPLHALKSSILLAAERRLNGLYTLIILPQLGESHDWNTLLSAADAKSYHMPSLPFFSHQVDATINSQPPIKLSIHTNLAGNWNIWSFTSINHGDH